MTNDFYVYIIFRSSGIPCYVGKGRGDRIDRHDYRCHSSHLRAIMRLSEALLPRLKLREGLSEAEAFETEIAFIAAIGREANGGPLVNKTDGGEGQSGRVTSEATRKKLRAAYAAQDPSKREAARLAAVASESYSRKMSDLQKGRPLTAEWRANISAGQTGKSRDPSGYEKTASWHRGRKRSPEACENMRKARLASLAKKASNG